MREIISCERQMIFHTSYSIAWLLMSWWLKGTGASATRVLTYSARLAYHFLASQRSLADDEPSVIRLWVGIGGFSKVVATFSHVGGSLNLVLATTRDIWVITSFRIWVMYCMLSTFMCHHELWPTSASHPFSFLNSFLSYARLKNGCIVPWQCPFYLSVCPSSFSALKWCIIFMYWRAFPVGSIHISVWFYVCETTRCASTALL